jgi:glycogen operon protein
MDGSRADILADRDDNDFFIMFNSGAKQVKCKVCEPLAGKRWYLAVDTSLPSPGDIQSPGQERLLPDQDEYFLQGRSMAILLSKVE